MNLLGKLHLLSARVSLYGFIIIIIYRCGKDLTALYHSPGVQSFLNGISAKALLSSKTIYQPGILRKVQMYNNASNYDLLYPNPIGFCNAYSVERLRCKS